jgi:hypothetical protein
MWGGSPDPRATPGRANEPGQGAGLRTQASAPLYLTEIMKLV